MDWKDKYMVTPWVDQGREVGKGLDCWGLVVAIYLEKMGVELNPYPTMSLASHPRAVAKLIRDEGGRSAKGENGWTKTDTPKDFDLVLLFRGTRSVHVGVYLEQDGGIIMHSYQGGNTVLQRVSNCSDEWAALKYYRHD